MLPTPAIRSWLSRNAFTGCLRPRASARRASAVKSALRGSTPRRDPKYSSSASPPSSTSPVPKRRTSTNSRRVASSSSNATRVCGGFSGSSVSSRLPVMRRCMTRWTSSSTDRIRYLPRRPTLSIRRPRRASSIASGGAGSHNRASSTRTSTMRRPARAGASWRRIVSTSGSSGKARLTLRDGRARVRLEVDVLQAVTRQVRVQLGRRHVGVAEHLLNRAQVAAAGQQVGGEGVAQGVRAHAVGQAGARRVPADDLVEALARQLPAAEVHEQVHLGAVLDQLWAPALEVDVHRAHGRLADRHDALLRTLAARAQDALVEVDVAQLEPDRLGGAQTRRVHQLQQRPVAQGVRLGPVRLGEQLLDLATGQDLGQLSAAPRGAERRRGGGFAQALAAQVSVEGAKAGRLAVDGGRRGGAVVVVAGRQVGEEVADLTRAGVERRQVVLLQVATELEQVAAVCLESVAREAALELQIGQEVEHEVLEPRLDQGLFERGHRMRGSPAPRSLLELQRLRQGVSKARSQSRPASDLASRQSLIASSRRSSGTAMISIRSFSSASALSS